MKLEEGKRRIFRSNRRAGLGMVWVDGFLRRACVWDTGEAAFMVRPFG